MILVKDVILGKIRVCSVMVTFKDRSQLDIIEVTNNQQLSFKYFNHGGAFQLSAADIMINQVIGTPIDGNINNIYIRVKQDNRYAFAPLLGPTVQTSLSTTNNQACWTGEFEGISYQCQLVLDETHNAWNWNVNLTNTASADQEIDMIYGQDIAIIAEGSVRVNEAYCCQYIDHYIFSNAQGYTVASRQNQKTPPQGHPWLIQGCLQKTVGYVTDGFDFYGLSYKETGVPEALTQEKLISEKRQYEFAFIGLQTEAMTLKSKDSSSFNFFAHLEFDHPEATSDNDAQAIQEACLAAQQRLVAIDGEKQAPLSFSLFNSPSLINGENLNDQDLVSFFPGEHRHCEQNNNRLLSFFYDQHHYVSLKSKELLCERPHGHIIRSGQDLNPGNDQVLSSTNYMYGIFHSHVTIGNTSFNKFLSITRSPLNIFKSSGQRIFIERNGQWQLLNLPSAYEVAPDFTRWIYKLANDVITIKAWVSPKEPICHLEVQSNKNHTFLVSNNLTVGNNEWDNTIDVDIDPETFTVQARCSSDCLLKNTYPDASFYVTSATPDQIESIGDDAFINLDGQSQSWPYVVFKTKATQNFSLSITGDLFDPAKAKKRSQASAKTQPYFDQDHIDNMSFWTQTLGQNFSIELADNENVSKINDIVFWYLHNGMIHYSTPHGLEQFSGGAWGLRDVCQGPLELLLSMGHTKPVKEILKMVFQQQYVATADWPQWFMFDRYVKIQHAESHGDIIIWPLSALASYIEASNDFSFLKEKVPFMDHNTFELTREPVSILDHAKRTVEAIVAKFIPNTHLSCYGEGDWDDTLQPADESMCSNMVSTWSVALTYQSFGQLEQVVAKTSEKAFADRLNKLRSNIKKDFNQYLIKDGVVSGFIYFRENSSIDYMLHPSDKKLGLKYRLLPMTRSMIAELFEPAQMKDHLKIIEDHLDFPDGVHLMNEPVTYKGGPRLYFRRADEAANWGREIGIQYVHAHIRYIEAMCKIGASDKAYKAILKIIPITINKSVPNAILRQSNSYFSSSDGNFKDRYLAKKGFHKLKTGATQVKGGWRIYSSGPGIFNNQVISHFFGIRPSFDDLVLDPVLPVELNDVKLSRRIGSHDVDFYFHIQANACGLQRVLVNKQNIETQRENNPYRMGGLRISQPLLNKALTTKTNRIDIYMES